MMGSKPTGGLGKALNLGNVAVEGLGFDEDEAGCPWSSGQVSRGKFVWGDFFSFCWFGLVLKNGGKMGWWFQKGFIFTPIWGRFPC